MQIIINFRWTSNVTDYTYLFSTTRWLFERNSSCQFPRIRSIRRSHLKCLRPTVGITGSKRCVVNFCTGVATRSSRVDFRTVCTGESWIFSSLTGRFVKWNDEFVSCKHLTEIRQCGFCCGAVESCDVYLFMLCDSEQVNRFFLIWVV